MSGSYYQSLNQHELDCQHLHIYFSGNRAMHREKLVEIILQRNLRDYKVIRENYAALYGEDLLHVISMAQKTDPFARAAYLRMHEPYVRDAEIIRNSLSGESVNLNTLIEIACTRPSSDLAFIKKTYRSLYNSDLEQDVNAEVSGGYTEILLAVLKSCRNYGGKVNMSMAMCDAKTLYEALESGISVDQKTILSLLSQRNTSQLQAILVSFKELYGHELSKSLKQRRYGQFGREVRIIIRCVQTPEKFFAKLIRMKSGDAREVLIRVAITRSDIDIKDINKVYAAKTGSTLENLVRKEFNNGMGVSNDIVTSVLRALLKD